MVSTWEDDAANCDWLFGIDDERPKPRTVEQFLIDCGGLCEARIAEEEYSANELLKCARTKVFGETLYWVLAEMGESR